MLLVVLASGGAPTTRVAETGGLTATALAVIAAFAVLVLVGILYGARQKRIRAAAEEEEKQRAAELAAQDEAAPAPVAAETAPKPEAASAAKPKPAPKTAAKPRAKPAAIAPATPEPVAPTLAPEPEPAPAPAPAGHALTDVKGLGPKAAAILTGLGIPDVAALAALDPARAAEVDGQLGNFAGRLTRDRWVEQAKLLAAGDIAAFEATYGKL